MSVLGKLRRSLLGASFEKVASFRGGDSATWQRLEKVARTVVQGYNMTLEDSTFEVLIPRLNAIEPEFRAFAYEGAGMGLMLLDCMLPWQKRFHAFVDGPGSPFTYVAYIGAGEAIATLHKHPERLLARLDPLLGWLGMDGYGFHEGFFSRRRYIEEKTIPTHLSHHARHIFDQGLGRSIWFLEGADIDRIAATVATFSATRQADLWSGVGVAYSSTGDRDRAALEALWVAAGPHHTRLAQGAAVVALARQQAGIPVAHTDLACEVWCSLSSDRAAHIADAARQNLPPDGTESAYEIWRQRIEAQFVAQEDRGITHAHTTW